ncbi:MAG: ribosome recycling factor [Rhodothermales bacterium]
MIGLEMKEIVADTKEQMNKSLEHLAGELKAIRAGRATPSMLDTVLVEYYGSMTPLNQVASVSAPSPDLLLVQVWDKSAVSSIERGIMAANIGLNPSNDGELIRIPVPPLSEERRHDLVKVAKNRGEEVKVSLRNVRRSARDEIKRIQKDQSLPEDMRFEAEERVEKLTHEFIEAVDHALEKKEIEILEV